MFEHYALSSYALTCALLKTSAQPKGSPWTTSPSRSCSCTCPGLTLGGSLPPGGPLSGRSADIPQQPLPEFYSYVLSDINILGIILTYTIIIIISFCIIPYYAMLHYAILLGSGPGHADRLDEAGSPSVCGPPPAPLGSSQRGGLVKGGLAIQT